jgi:hypothetical protein
MHFFMCGSQHPTPNSTTQHTKQQQLTHSLTHSHTYSLTHSSLHLPRTTHNHPLKMSNFAQVLIDLIFQPGSSLTLIPFINASVVALMVVLCFLTYTEIATIHLVVMSTLSLGLLASVNW